MRLVIEGFGDTQIDFIAGPDPEGEVKSAFELFEDHTREKLQRVLETFAELFGGGEDIEDYCLTVGNYWREVCSDNPAICPVNPNMPDCTP